AGPVSRRHRSREPRDLARHELSDRAHARRGEDRQHHLSLREGVGISSLYRKSPQPPECVVEPRDGVSGLVNHHEPRCSPTAKACPIKSPSLTMPTTLPSAATTGTPLMRLACRIWAISATEVSGPTVTTSRVMTSATVSTAVPPSIRSAGAWQN